MSSFILKTIALLAMTLDHCGTYLPNISPIYFKMIGRLSGPIFLFCFSNSMKHTTNRYKLLSRLYIASLITSIGNFILIYHYKSNLYILGNFFPTLFTIGVVIQLFEKKYSSKRKKHFTIIAFVLLQNIIGALVLFPFIQNLVRGNNLNLTTSKLLALTGFFPNYITCESGILWVALGLMFYVFRDSKKKQLIVLAIYSTLMLILQLLANAINYNMLQYEWMALFAGIFIYLYNQKQGKLKLKFFFYIYYPLHIWLLYSFGNSFRF